MPALGAGMEDGRVVEWHVAPGQEVHRGDVIAMIETDKANIDVEVFESGVIDALLVPVGARVPVGTPLATIVPAAEAPPPTERVAPVAVEPGPPAAEAVAPATVPEPAAAVAAPTPTPHVHSPVVRRLAAAHGIDLADVEPTGPADTITRADVEQVVAARSARAVPTSPRASPYARRLASERGSGLEHLTGSGPGGAVVGRDVPEGPARPTAVAVPPPHVEAQAPAAADQADARRRAMRSAIARAMTRSNTEIPQYHLGEHVDVEDTLRWLDRRNDGLPAARRVLPAALLLRATALACRRVPDLNGFWIDDALVPGDGVHLGVAVALRGGGLLVPAIRDADRLDLDETMAAMRDVVQRARSGGLRGSELTDATITVTNLGDTGVETVHPLIHPPQVAIVGAGRIRPVPAVVDGMVGPRRMLHLTLAGDHRATDGHRGSQFLAAIAAHLTEPETL